MSFEFQRVDNWADCRPDMGYNPEFIRRTKEKRRRQALEKRLEAERKAKEERLALIAQRQKLKEEIQRLQADIDTAKRQSALEVAAEKQAEIEAKKRASIEADDSLVVFAIRSLPFKKIVRRISKATGISELELLSHKRSRHIVFARQAIIYWACRRTKMSLADIGRRMGRDHTTILYGKDQYVDRRAAMGRTLRKVR